MSHSEGSRILLVDDEPDNLKALERTLRQKFEIVSCLSAQAALEEINHRGKAGFSVVISDQRMPGMLGTEFLSRVAKLSPLSTRVILTAFTDTRDILEAINRAEIYRYITKPWDNQELLSTIQQAAEHYRLRFDNEILLQELFQKNLRLTEKERELTALNRNLEKLVEARTSELQRANERLGELAITDPLTGVTNRRGFFERFHQEIERCRRYRRSMVVAMIDVDHFKRFNDQEGHIAGDEALKRVSQIFLASLRKTDLLARYGGEEFILMMPETEIANAIEICERLRFAVENSQFEGAAAPTRLTVSVGMACFPDDGAEATLLIKSADDALYRAKELGRNRVVYK